MGQSLSFNHPPPPVRLATHRQSLKRVYRYIRLTFVIPIFIYFIQFTLLLSIWRYSEETEEAKRSVSVSLPASPSIRRRAVTPDESAAAAGRVPLSSFESVLKNLEEFAQHQWPTWAKRRGWSTDVNPSELAGGSSSSITDDGSGRVVQVDKDKWVFLRHRKKGTPSISPVVIIKTINHPIHG